MSLNEYQINMMAVAETVRNHCAEICRKVGVDHFANDLAWSQEDVDPLEIAAEKGGSDGAYECVSAIDGIDCYAILALPMEDNPKNTLAAHDAIFSALFEIFPDCRCIGDLPGCAKELLDRANETKKYLALERDAHMYCHNALVYLYQALDRLHDIVTGDAYAENSASEIASVINAARERARKVLKPEPI